eukprot:4334783-Prymnesium_polylepis.1
MVQARGAAEGGRDLVGRRAARGQLERDARLRERPGTLGREQVGACGATPHHAEAELRPKGAARGTVDGGWRRVVSRRVVCSSIAFAGRAAKGASRGGGRRAPPPRGL